MARPRSVRANQPMIIRPLAANTLAADAPPTANRASTAAVPEDRAASADDPDRERGQQQAGGHHLPLAEPVGRGAPGDQGGEQARGRRGDVGAGRGQREAELVAQVRHEERHPVDEGAGGGLREHGDREHHPPSAGRLLCGGGGHAPTVRRRYQ